MQLAWRCSLEHSHASKFERSVFQRELPDMNHDSCGVRAVNKKLCVDPGWTVTDDQVRPIRILAHQIAHQLDDTAHHITNQSSHRPYVTCLNITKCHTMYGCIRFPKPCAIAQAIAGRKLHFNKCWGCCPGLILSQPGVARAGGFA